MAEVQNDDEKNRAPQNAVVFSALKPQLLVEAPKANDAVQFSTNSSKRKAEQELPLILSADLKLGDSVFSVAGLPEDAFQAKTEGNGFVFSLVTEDVNAAIAKAVSAGAVAEGEVTEDEVVAKKPAGVEPVTTV